MRTHDEGKEEWRKKVEMDRITFEALAGLGQAPNPRIYVENPCHPDHQVREPGPDSEPDRS